VDTATDKHLDKPIFKTPLLSYLYNDHAYAVLYPIVQHMVKLYLKDAQKTKTELGISSSARSSATDIVFGYEPVSIAVGCYTQNHPLDGNQYRWVHRLCQMSYDASNCGIGYFHDIHPLFTRQGYGSHILSFIEHTFSQQLRKYIICSINTIQTRAGAGIWLRNSGYQCIDTFTGGNSGNECALYTKDLNLTPFVKVKELI